MIPRYLGPPVKVDGWSREPTLGRWSGGVGWWRGMITALLATDPRMHPGWPPKRQVLPWWQTETPAGSPPPVSINPWNTWNPQPKKPPTPTIMPGNHPGPERIKPRQDYGNPFLGTSGGFMTRKP